MEKERNPKFKPKPHTNPAQEPNNRAQPNSFSLSRAWADQPESAAHFLSPDPRPTSRPQQRAQRPTRQRPRAHSFAPTPWPHPVSVSLLRSTPRQPAPASLSLRPGPACRIHPFLPSRARPPELTAANLAAPATARTPKSAVGFLKLHPHGLLLPILKASAATRNPNRTPTPSSAAKGTPAPPVSNSAAPPYQSPVREAPRLHLDDRIFPEPASPLRPLQRPFLRELREPHCSDTADDHPARHPRPNPNPGELPHPLRPVLC